MPAGGGFCPTDHVVRSVVAGYLAQQKNITELEVYKKHDNDMIALKKKVNEFYMPFYRSTVFLQ